MCFNEYVSWLTLVVGTTANGIAGRLCERMRGSRGESIITPLLIIFMWQYTLLMQIPDSAGLEISQRNIPREACVWSQCLTTTRVVYRSGVHSENGG